MAELKSEEERDYEAEIEKSLIVIFLMMKSVSS